MTATPHRNASSPVPSRARNHRQSWPAERATPPRERPSTRQIYAFADESGDFSFSNQAASKYFTLGTIVLYDPTIGDRLLALRREWASEGLGLNTTLHATEDEQAVHDRVFTFLGSEDFEADFTVLEKRKLPTSVRSQQAPYKDAWTRHFKTMGPAACRLKTNSWWSRRHLAFAVSAPNYKLALTKPRVGPRKTLLPSSLLAVRLRSLSPDRRLLHLGGPPQVRTPRQARLQSHQDQDQERGVATLRSAARNNEQVGYSGNSSIGHH